MALRELLLHNHLAGCAEHHKVKGRLTQVDAYRMYLHSDDPPSHKLLVRSSCSCRRIKRRTISLVGISEVIGFRRDGELRPMYSSSMSYIPLFPRAIHGRWSLA